MKTAKLLLVLSIVSVFCTGCLSTAFREGKGAAMGASGIDVQLQGSPNLEEYSNFEVGSFIDGMLNKTPGKLLKIMPGLVKSEMANYTIPMNRGGKTVVITGVVIHYDVASDAISTVFGPFEEAVVRVMLTDKATSRIIGTANCIGRSNANTNKGLEQKARGVGKAIVKWIGKHRKIQKIEDK